MVYCGKPSKGCQMCRMRRIKCDETKPTCDQCARARRQCPGYRDEFDLMLRDENLAAKRRALRSNGRKKMKSSPSSSSQSWSRSGVTTATPSSASSLPTTTTTTSRTIGTTLLPTPDPTPSPPMTTITTATTTTGQVASLDSPFDQPLLPSLSIPIEQQASCHFVSNFVLVPPQGSTRGGFMDWLLPLLSDDGNTSTTTTVPNSNGSTGTGTGTSTRAGLGGEGGNHLRHAFNACALASLGNRVAHAGGADGHVRGELGRMAFAEYNRALRATQAVLRDGEGGGWKGDGVLGAVLLLGMFENITAKQLGHSAWGSHVEGAIQLAKARGRDQLRTKVGVQLFVAVRTQLIIHTLTSATAPAMGVDWWLHDAVVDPTAAACQRLNLLTAELRADVTRVMAGVTRTPDSVRAVRGLMARARAVDDEITAWMRSLPDAWRAKTLCWQTHSEALPSAATTGTGGGDYAKAEVFPGRVDVYADCWTAAVWNMVRTARLVLMSVTLRCVAWVRSPVDYRTTPEYATAARTCVDTISDILASVPYHLGWHTRRRELFAGREPLSTFACGDEDGIKGLSGYFLTWPLACVMSQDFATDSQRAYIKGRLKYIGDELGVKYAHILSQLEVRLPSMLIRRDGLVANPYPMAHNFEKLLSSARRGPPVADGFAVNPLLQREAMQRQQFEQGRGELLAKAATAAGVAGEEARYIAQKWLAV